MTILAVKETRILLIDDVRYLQSKLESQFSCCFHRLYVIFSMNKDVDVRFTEDQGSRTRNI